MTVLAEIRPDELNWALLLHVGGAMILVGAVLTAASALTFARGDAQLLRLGYFSLLAVGLPGYILMRIGGQWIYSKEGLDDAPIDAAWTGIGFFVADVGALLLLIALIVGGIGVYRLRAGRGAGFLRATMVMSLVMLASYVVAVWAMSAKPN